jgi:hypothetical protein
MVIRTIHATVLRRLKYGKQNTKFLSENQIALRGTSHETDYNIQINLSDMHRKERTWIQVL